jgi:acid phosphatase
MKSSHLTSLAASTFALLAAACSCAMPHDATPSTTPMAAVSGTASQPCDTTIANLNATLWMQSSAEYRAIVREIYNTAARTLDAALADPSWTAADEQTAPANTLPPAIVLDLDETALDTSAFQARMIKTSKPFTEPRWHDFALEGSSLAIPEAVDFLNIAQKRNVAIFYVTNRVKTEKEALLRNLRALGFPNVSEESVLLRGERPEWETGDKSPRRAFIAQRYRVMMLLGDDLNDFAPAAGKSLQERSDIVRAHTDWLGTRWFVIPNPSYGSWQRASIYGQAKTDLCGEMQQAIQTLRSK